MLLPPHAVQQAPMRCMLRMPCMLYLTRSLTWPTCRARVAAGDIHFPGDFPNMQQGWQQQRQQHSGSSSGSSAAAGLPGGPWRFGCTAGPSTGPPPARRRPPPPGSAGRWETLGGSEGGTEGRHRGVITRPPELISSQQWCTRFGRAVRRATNRQRFPVQHSAAPACCRHAACTDGIHCHESVCPQVCTPTSQQEEAAAEHHAVSNLFQLDAQGGQREFGFGQFLLAR